MVKDVNEIYKARCLAKLKTLELPLDHWKLVEVYDAFEGNEESGDFHICELCGCSKVRFVHVMKHDDVIDTLSVGCLCAGVMMGDILKVKELEKQIKSYSSRRCHFIGKYLNRINGKTYRYKKHDVKLTKTNGVYEGLLDGFIDITTYKGHTINNDLELVYAIFNAIVEKPEYLCLRK